MSTSTIDAALLQKMFLAGARNLELNKEWINDLNVFPVPDGDTGTNMTLTILSAAREVSQIEEPTMEKLAKAISSGSLRGARGNSGVILSQLFRGFTKEIKTTTEIDTLVLASAMVRAAETAYKAVMKPKEGTILTVAKGMAEKASELAQTDMELGDMMKAIIAHGDVVLSQTPELLPVLKQAGVVDSGGQGLMQVVKGAVDAYFGKEVELVSFESTPKAVTAVPETEELETADIKFGYCTEFIIMLEPGKAEYHEQELKSFLESIGDSIVCVSDDDIVKIHVHTNDPGLAIQKGLSYGSLTRMKIDNMREEHQEKLIKDAEKIAAEQKAKEAEQKARELEATALPEAEPEKEYGFIAVSVGDGLSDIFKGLGVDCLIEGGQTMNPSTEDMLDAIEKVPARNIFIFPNNKNIILAAEQARYLTDNKNIIVIPTKSVPQGITAILNFSPESTPDENAENMKAEIELVQTAQITYAVRNTVIDDMEIHEGDMMGIGDHGMLSVGTDKEVVALESVEKMTNEDTTLISVYYGCDVEEADAARLHEKLESLYPQMDIELNQGGQPIYYYIISVE
ncbi:MAG: DAK2 domain-containing protein [Lachnospiraceae bacterium]|nr:DAK2 domain-containing protein [Lachnospiraceae bacterium]